MQCGKWTFYNLSCLIFIKFFVIWALKFWSYFLAELISNVNSFIEVLFYKRDNDKGQKILKVIKSCLEK